MRIAPLSSLLLFDPPHYPFEPPKKPENPQPPEPKELMVVQGCICVADDVRSEMENDQIQYQQLKAQRTENNNFDLHKSLRIPRSTATW